MSDSVLEIKNLTFGYDKNSLIYEDFNLEVKRGEVVSIVGESGSGKSTLFELIIGELTPHSGSIKKSNISQIFQDPYSSFHPSYSVLNQIEDVVSIEGIEVHLEKLDLSIEQLYKKPHELSGGQLQRCSIIRAILMKPDLLLADEPTSALDNVIQLNVMKNLISLLGDFSLLLITHDRDLASWCSDKIIKIGK